MKKYEFFLVPKQGVPHSDIEIVMQEGQEELAGVFRVRRLGSQLVCSHVVPGPIWPPQQKDYLVQLFMEAEPLLRAPIRLSTALVKYFNIPLPHRGTYVVQDSTVIFSHRDIGKVRDVPAYIICRPFDRSVAIAAHFIREENPVACRQAFYALQREVEELLTTSAQMYDQLQKNLRMWMTEAYTAKKA